MPGDWGRRTVVLDACVLVGTIRRHVLLSLAEAELFQPVWSPEILDETERAIPKALGRSDIPVSHHKNHASRIRYLMGCAFPYASAHLVKNTFSQPALPDPDDTHVLALAQQTEASIIVTENLRDFPAKVLAPLGVTAISADHFAAFLCDHSPDTCMAAMTRLTQRINRQDVDWTAFLARMKQTGFRQFSAKLAAM